MMVTAITTHNHALVDANPSTFSTTHSQIQSIETIIAAWPSQVTHKVHKKVETENNTRKEVQQFGVVSMWILEYKVQTYLNKVKL